MLVAFSSPRKSIYDQRKFVASCNGRRRIFRELRYSISAAIFNEGKAFMRRVTRQKVQLLQRHSHCACEVYLHVSHRAISMAYAVELLAPSCGQASGPISFHTVWKLSCSPRCLAFLFFFLYWVIFQSRIQEGNPKRPSFAPGNGGYPRVNASRSHTGGWCSERRPNQGRAMGTESIASELQGLR